MPQRGQCISQLYSIGKATWRESELSIARAAWLAARSPAATANDEDVDAAAVSKRVSSGEKGSLPDEMPCSVKPANIISCISMILTRWSCQTCKPCLWKDELGHRRIGARAEGWMAQAQKMN